jgi:hypothetical protein
MPAYQATNRPGFRCDFALANGVPAWFRMPTLFQ